MQTFGVLLSFIVPALVLRLEKRVKAVRALSPVLVCYTVGMLIGNMPGVEIDHSLSLAFGNVCIAVAIPLMLFSMDVLGWLRLARSTVLSFGLAVAASMVAALAAGLAFSSALPEADRMAGMLSGVYIGGTPNMAAIGAALGAQPETFMKLNAADMIWSSLYLLWILAAARRLYALWLPSFPHRSEDDCDLDAATVRSPLAARLAGAGLALLVVAAAWLLSLPIPASFRDAALILIITSLAAAASFCRRVRALPGTDRAGYFLLLVFSTVIGTTARFDRLFAASFDIFLFTGAVLAAAAALHLLAASLFKIDRDTLIITSTAAIWSPAMVAPVAVALKNRELLGPGIASGLVGYALANYAGLFVSWLLN